MPQWWMLWLDGDVDSSPNEMVLEAIKYYQRKYGERPNRVQAPHKFPVVEVEGVLIERARNVIEGHLLLAFDDEVFELGKGGEV